MIKELIKRVQIHETSDSAAVLAYYFLLSLFPLLIFLVALIPYFSFDISTLLQMIQQYAPGNTNELLSVYIEDILTNTNGGLLSFGILGTLWSASNATNALIRSLNKAYSVPETRPFWKVRLHAIFITVGLVFTFVLTLSLPVFGNALLHVLSLFLPAVHSNEWILQGMRFILSFFIMAIVLIALYFIAPNVRMKVSEVYIGAFIATLLWQGISLAFAFYVSQFGSFDITYGSLGAVIVLLMWLYLSGLVLLIGGEINAIYACEKGERFCKD